MLLFGVLCRLCGAGHLFCLRAHNIISFSLGFLPAFHLGGGELLVELRKLFLKVQKLLGETQKVVDGSHKVVGESPFRA